MCVSFLLYSFLYKALDYKSKQQHNVIFTYSINEVVTAVFHSNAYVRLLNLHAIIFCPLDHFLQVFWF